MTYIHFEKTTSWLNRTLAGLALAVILSVFWLVALYNNTVNLSHNISSAKAELDSIGAQNASLNHKVIAVLGNVQSSGLAAQDGLTEDSHPQYVRTNASWPIASQQ